MKNIDRLAGLPYTVAGYMENLVFGVTQFPFNVPQTVLTAVTAVNRGAGMLGGAGCGNGNSGLLAMV